MAAAPLSQILTIRDDSLKSSIRLRCRLSAVRNAGAMPLVRGAQVYEKAVDFHILLIVFKYRLTPPECATELSVAKGYFP